MVVDFLANEWTLEILSLHRRVENYPMEQNSGKHIKCLGYGSQMLQTYTPDIGKAHKILEETIPSIFYGDQCFTSIPIFHSHLLKK